MKNKAYKQGVKDAIKIAEKIAEEYKNDGFETVSVCIRYASSKIKELLEKEPKDEN